MTMAVLSSRKRDSDVEQAHESRAKWTIGLLCLTVLFTTIFGAPATADSLVALSSADRQVLASALETEREQLQNIRIDSEAWIERRMQATDTWKRTPIYVAATAWFDGRSERMRIDVHSENLEWFGGTVPYAESTYSVAFDGNVGTTINHMFGHSGKMRPSRRATIQTGSPEAIRGWLDKCTGIHASTFFFSRNRPYELTELIRSGTDDRDQRQSAFQTYRLAQAGSSRYLLRMSEVAPGESRSARQEYLLDPSRGFALIESKKVYTEDGDEKVLSHLTVSKLSEAAPGVWFPVQATFERPSSSPVAKERYERVVYHASNVVANDPNFDAGVFKMPIPPGYLVRDEIRGREYKSGDEQDRNER